MTEPRGAIYLVARAPLDISYQHTINFIEGSTGSPREVQRRYFESLVKYTLLDYSYVRRERRFVQVDKKFDELDDINYLFFNADAVRGTKTYYCFVTDREYVNDNLTRLYFEIDVMQTYLYDFKFQPSFITQAHVDRWDANHKPIYSKTEEGLNYGSEYITEAAYRIAPSGGLLIDPSTVGDLSQEDKCGFFLVFCSEHSDQLSSGTATELTIIDGTISPYVIYLLPNIEDGSNIEEYSAEYVLYDADGNKKDWYSEKVVGISQLQNLMQKSAFGNFIQHIVYVPYLPFEYQIKKHAADPKLGVCTLYDRGDVIARYGVSYIKNPLDTSGNADYGFIKIREITNAANLKLAEMPRNSGLDLALPSEDMFSALKAKPWETPFDRRFQSKLLCYPYRYNVFTDWNSAPALIKNEYMTGDTVDVYMSMAFSFNTPRRYWIGGYRGDPEGRESGVMQPLPCDQPITNDAYYSYMLQNKNQISANLTNATINAIAGATTGAAGGASGGAVGGPVGMIAGAVVGGAQSVVSGALNVQATIRSENAKQADLKNLPDTISNSNDCSFMISDGSKYLTLYRKKIACEYEDQLAQYWHMYGYKVNRLMVPNIRSRVRFNFIKTIGANILSSGDLDSSNINAIKQIFDNGITIWHCQDFDTFKPLDYSFENPEVSII